MYFIFLLFVQKTIYFIFRLVLPVLHLFRHRGKDFGACLVQQRAALDQLRLAKPVTVLLQARQRVWCWDVL